MEELQIRLGLGLDADRAVALLDDVEGRPVFAAEYDVGYEDGAQHHHSDLDRISMGGRECVEVVTVTPAMAPALREWDFTASLAPDGDALLDAVWDAGSVEEVALLKSVKSSR